MSFINPPKNTFVSKAVFVNKNTVEVNYRYKSNFLESVIVSFDEETASDFPYLAAAELFVLREKLIRGSFKDEDAENIPKKFMREINICLSSDLAEKAIKKVLAECLPFSHPLHGYAQFAFFWLRTASFFDENDKENIFPCLSSGPKKEELIFDKKAFASKGNLIDTPYFGNIEITFHAVKKCIDLSRFPGNKINPDDVVHYIVSGLTSKNLRQVENIGKVKEDKKFYCEEAEYWKLSKYVRCVLVDNPKENKKVLLTAYHRPYNIGKDPSERLVAKIDL